MFHHMGGLTEVAMKTEILFQLATLYIYRCAQLNNTGIES